MRTNVYIDGFNLYYGAIKNTAYKWLDLSKLCSLVLPNDQIQQIKYFTAPVKSRPHDPTQSVRQRVYLRGLETIPNLSIIYGHFLTHPQKMVITNSNPRQWVTVDKTEEKGSDVNLASHLLLDAFTGKFDLAVLITNDSDLAEPVRIVKEVVNLPVGIINPHQRHSVTLKLYATFMKRIRATHLRQSQFPHAMNDATGSFHKPSTW